MSLSAKIIRSIFRVTIAAVLIYAALPKINDPRAFAEAIDNYRIIPLSWSPTIALVLPWLELITALALFIPWLKRSGSLLATSLFAFFTLLQSITWARGLTIECGCFGSAVSTEQIPIYWRISIYALITLAAAYICRREFKTYNLQLQSRLPQQP